jgi:hypothetical protein
MSQWVSVASGRRVWEIALNADSVLGWLCGRELVHQAQNALLWAV